MEISFLGENSIKIRGRKNSIFVDPKPLFSSKTTAQVVLSLVGGATVQDPTLLIEGPGEYEVAGVKISAFGQRSKMHYDIRMNELKMLLANKDDLDKNQFEDAQYNLIILLCNSQVSDLSFILNMPFQAVLYGRSALDQARRLGKETSLISKLQVKNEATKSDIVVLG